MSQAIANSCSEVSFRFAFSMKTDGKSMNFILNFGNKGKGFAVGFYLQNVQ